eukprot:2193214-Rhodomonas_salina.1
MLVSFWRPTYALSQQFSISAALQDTEKLCLSGSPSFFITNQLDLAQSSTENKASVSFDEARALRPVSAGERGVIRVLCLLRDRVPAELFRASCVAVLSHPLPDNTHPLVVTSRSLSSVSSAEVSVRGEKEEEGRRWAGDGGALGGKEGRRREERRRDAGRKGGKKRGKTNRGAREADTETGRADGRERG